MVIDYNFSNRICNVFFNLYEKCQNYNYCEMDGILNNPNHKYQHKIFKTTVNHHVYARCSRGPERSMAVIDIFRHKQIHPMFVYSTAGLLIYYFEI